MALINDWLDPVVAQPRVTLSFSVVDFFLFLFRLKPIFSVWHFRCPPNNNNTRDAIFIEGRHASHISESI